MSLQSLKKLLDEGADNDEVVLTINRVLSSLNSYSQDELTECINSAAEWITKHSSSKKLESVLGLCAEIYSSQGFTEDFIFPLNEETTIMPLANLVSCVLSLINSILKSNQAEKYIRLLSKLLVISSYIVEQKTVPDSFRRKSSLKLMLTLFKNLVKAGAKSEHSVRVLSQLCTIISKMSYYSNKCREYIVRKGGIQVLCNILNQNSTYQKEDKLLYKALYALGTLAGNNDHQLLVWVSGGVSLSLAYFDRPDLLEPASFVLWRSCIDALEVQDTLVSQNFPEKAMVTLESSPTPEVCTFLIGTLRRLSNNAAYKETLAEPVSQCFLLWLKELTKNTYMLPLKELAAGLGSLCTKPEISQEVVKAAGIEIILEVILRHLDQAKLVKTCVGALVNLSVQGKLYVDGIVDRITSNLKFYEAVHNLLEKYFSSNFMMEYVLKLVLNGLQNNNCLYHLSEKRFLTSILKILDMSINDEEIFLLNVCILRATVSHSNLYAEKGLDLFKETAQPKMLESMLNGFGKNLSNIKILTEVILFISAVSQEEGPFLDYLKSSNYLSESIKACLEYHSGDKNHTAVLTECMANLPVEEFNMIL